MTGALRSMNPEQGFLDPMHFSRSFSPCRFCSSRGHSKKRTRRHKTEENHFKVILDFACCLCLARLHPKVCTFRTCFSQKDLWALPSSKELHLTAWLRNVEVPGPRFEDGPTYVQAVCCARIWDGGDSERMLALSARKRQFSALVSQNSS